MPDKTPPVYKWAVSLADGTRFLVEAAYPVIEDRCMALKDPGHKIVFAAGPGTGCTFMRGEPSDAPDAHRQAHVPAGPFDHHGAALSGPDPASFDDFLAAWDKECVKARDAEDGHWSPSVTLPGFLWPHLSHMVNPVTREVAKISRTAAFTWGRPQDEAAPEIAGSVTIEWPNAAECAPRPLRGSGAVVRDAGTGEPLRTFDLTVTAPGIGITRDSLGASGPVFADVTHPAAADGRVLDRDHGNGEADYWDPDTCGTAVRRYLVTRMSEIPPVEPWAAKVDRAGLAGFLKRVHDDGGTVEALTLTADDMRELAHGGGPILAMTYTEDGVSRPERVASTRITCVGSRAAGGAEIPVSMAADGEESSALVRYGPDGPQARTIAVAADSGTPSEVPA